MKRLSMLLAVVLCACVASLPAVPQPAGAAVPSHVPTYLYYGAWHLNEAIPVAYIVSHAEYIEADASQAPVVNQFKAAGGKYAVMYTDPTYIPYCVPPFTPPAGACKGPIGNQDLPESAWFHGSNGERIRREDDYTHQYQEMLNPASAAARAAYHRFTSQIAAEARVDYFWADDSGSPLLGADHTAMTGALYKFNAPAAEVTTDQAYLQAMKGLMAAAARPVIINGSDPATHRPPYGGALLVSPNVIGQNSEGCFLNGSIPHPLSDAGHQWQYMADGLLSVTHLRRYAFCMMQGDLLANPAARLYATASWWLTYDPQFSVIAPVSPGTDGYAVFAEESIVPTDPLRTAQNSVDDLHSGDLYVREFAHCYQSGRAIGGCAAVVNPSSTRSIDISGLSQHYHSALTLSAKSSFGGGTATWGPMRTNLGPIDAVILRTS